MSDSLLLTRRRGPDTATPYLVLHDRWGKLEDAEALGARLGPDALSIAIRAPRVQTQGGSGMTHGYFWTIGTFDTPELSTLGDALYQLERLLDETWERYGRKKLGLLGQGQGGVLALVLAAFFPDRVGRVVAIDALMPTNLGDMPFEPSLSDVEVIVAHTGAAPDAERIAVLTALGGAVSTIPEAELDAKLQG